MDPRTPRSAVYSAIRVLLASVATACVQPSIAAAPAVDETPSDRAQTVNVTARTGAYSGDKEAASAVAPTQSSLMATQPQSVITRDFIERAVTPAAEYSAIINLAPSLSGFSRNGPGLSETKTTMRGFGDDQYNITFDGIPWGDTNNPAHHSTSFFPASVIGGVLIERGPGNASNLGFATFGGSVNLFSKKLGEQQETGIFGSIGTWNTRVAGFSHETGNSEALGGGRAWVNFQEIRSDGYLSYNAIKSDNYTAKLEKATGSDSVLTLFASVNRIRYVQPDNSNGATLAQVALYGKSYSLNDDPTSFNYRGFNYSEKATDFEYARLKTAWGTGASTEVQAYTYSYDNQTISSTDPTGATAPGTKAGVPGNKNIPGIDKQNKYRVWGAIGKMEFQTAQGLLRTGAWLERSSTDRHQYDLDLSLGYKVPNPAEKTAPLTVKFDQQSSIQSFQPFVEFEWEPVKGMTVTPGVKDVRITRAIDAPVNQTTRTPLNTSLDYHTTLPFLTINRQLGSGLAMYAQTAKGFQIPDLNTFYISDPTKNSSEPQMSTNYQIGLVGVTRDLLWDVDVYRIDFKNKYVSNGLTGANQAYINIGGAQYQGVEGQLTAKVGGGFALYGNFSSNKATSLDTGKQISGAPLMTAGLGVLFDQGPWSATVVHKRTGAIYMTEYTASTAAAYDKYKVEAVDNTDLGVSYTAKAPMQGVKSAKLQLNVFNLANRQAVTSIKTASTAAYDQYSFQPPRSFQVSGKFLF